VTYDSITNRGDYLSPYYLAEKLPVAIREKGGLRARWAERDVEAGRGKGSQQTPVKALRALRRDYFDARVTLTDEGEDADLKAKTITGLNDSVLLALGFRDVDPETVTVERAGESYEIPVAYAGPNVIALGCHWAADTDAALDAEDGGRLLDPVVLGSSETIETGVKLARWLFAAQVAGAGEPPRYVLLVHGGVVVLADRLTWGEGRYLAVSLDVALERANAGTDELETIAALFSADALQPPAEGGSEPLATFVDGSRQHAVGVSSELREGLRESVQIIANEVLDRLRSQGLTLADLDATARDLGRESLRYLYRILFLLYAEARPELGILPADDDDYIAGYSMARLGELVTRRLGGDEARQGFHLYSSLDLLFRMVNGGHNARGSVAVADDASEGEGLRFEALKADLFDPRRTHLIGRVEGPESDGDSEGTAEVDTRLRDAALYQVLRRLMLAKGKGRGSGRRGRTERGGFISYAQLGINQLGAVYEGLMSYTGFIAAEELYEVAKGGDPSGGSWMIPASKADGYADEVFVREVDEHGVKTREKVRYKAGSFVYRLAGRDRQTSASYYTPQSLTSVTVQLALEQREKEEGRVVAASEVLRWRVCEPALGSGAFLNEAIDQLAALYLRKREAELDVRLEPDERALALQRVKAYIALHNCYGVDLNETAVELAEVSIWLNVMHRGLQAPWFGLHLVRGNSLIGCGRRLYPASSLADKSWLKSAPVDHPFSAGPLLHGHVHHFLLPAAGWGAVASEKEAKQLAPDDTAKLAAWRKKIQAAPSAKKSAGHKLSQVARLQALAVRAEYLWHLVVERLRISEREISRAIAVWGTDGLPEAVEAIPRDQIVDDLTSAGTPYWRLKTLMDAWCALWFWPVGKAELLDGSGEVYRGRTAEAPFAVAVTAPAAEPERVDPDPAFPQVWEMDSLFGESTKQLVLSPAPAPKPRKPKPGVNRQRPVPLKSLDDWLEFAEALLGRQDIAGLAKPWDSLTELSDHEDQLHDEAHMNMDSWTTLGERFPWLDTVHEIAEDQGFFHWELRFASVFNDGGFDLQVGNPPWVRPQWDEDGVLAEYEPWFKLAVKTSVDEKAARRTVVLEPVDVREAVIDERTVVSAMVDFLRSPQTYPLLVGTQPDSYRAFMARTWANAGERGAIGLVHPDTHFTGEREGLLRENAYVRLRVHGDFVNPGHRFFPEPVGESSHFGVHIYGPPGEIGFDHLSWLFSVEALRLSAQHDGSGDSPSIRYRGKLDERPHRRRIVRVSRDALELWQGLTGSGDDSVFQVRLLSPVSTDEQDAIRILASYPVRVGQFGPQLSSGFHEKGAKDAGLIGYDLSQPGDWSEIILKGIQLGVATSLFKSPTAGSNDVLGWDLTKLGVDAAPETEYRRITDRATFQEAQDLWVDHRSNGTRRTYTEFYRLAWRRMIAPDTERSLYAAIIPPGPSYIDGIMSLAMSDNRSTALASGFFCSLPLDYFIRVAGMGHLQISGAKLLPFGSLDHPLASALLLRTTRLNCLTTAYADLWAEVYDDAWRDDAWACSWDGLPPLAEVGPTWKYDSPLRTERARRAALVEIDALVAVWLGMDVDALIAMYNARFPVMNRFEESMWFDADGWKLAGNHRTIGQIQQKSSYDELLDYIESGGTTKVPDGYTPPFYKADRIAEYRQAHAAFAERLKSSGRTGG
jgi:hypothetical protein